MLKLPHFLDNRLTDGSNVVSLTRRTPFTPRNIPRYIESGRNRRKHRLSVILRHVYVSVAYKWTSYCSTVRFCGNVFSDPLSSSGHDADHIENNSCNTFSIVCSYFGRCLEMALYVTMNFFLILVCGAEPKVCQLQTVCYS
jgi:hypothetical protein